MNRNQHLFEKARTMKSNSDERTDFNDRARGWDAKQSRVEMAGAVARAMLTNLTLTREMTMMDYGAGTGLVTLHLRPHVRRIDAVDSSEGMLAVLQEKVRSQDIDNIESILLPPENGGIPERSYDVIVSSMTMHHVADVSELARAFYGSLNPGGQIALADLVEEQGDFHSDNTGVQHFGFNTDAFAEIFRNAGFRNVRVSIVHTVTKETRAGEIKDFPLFLLTGSRD